MKITQKTKVEQLILKGASVDGKIVQQVALIKRGIDIPDTYFFTAKDVEFNLKDMLREIICDENAQYQIRTENFHEFNREMDFFSESRLGLSHDELEKNLISVCKRNTIGIVQRLPKNSLNRDLVSGLACLTKDKKIHIDFLNGIATYIARVGICDGSLICPFEDVKHIDKNIYYKSKKEQLQNFIYTVMRYGVKSLKKKYKLPFNEDRDRTKKEYELSSEELSQEFFIEEKIELPRDIEDKFSVNCDIDFSENTFKVALMRVGLNSILESDDQDVAKKFLLGGEIGEEVYREILESIVKLGDFILESHLVSFSWIESEGEKRLVIWDLPLDRKTERSMDDVGEVTWIRNIDDYEIGENIGIDVPIDSETPDRILDICSEIKKKSKDKVIYIKYSILSHLATIIREQGFEVVKYLK